ncbi:MAG: hypothetical protein JEZ08_02205 [Clostridiales bacterium]|nr:hypothetical protein [Clostridiales bacterium]
MKIANKNKVNTPKVIAYGTYEDVYSLPYIIMEYAKGVEASEILSTLDDNEKKYSLNSLMIF